MDAFGKLLKLSDKLDGQLSKVAMESSEALESLNEIVTYWIPEDKKNIAITNARLSGEYLEALDALKHNQLQEMNAAVASQAYQNIQGNHALLDYIPKFEEFIKELIQQLENRQPSGMELVEIMSSASVSLLNIANETSDSLKKNKIFMNPRELKSWRKLSVTIRDAMTDAGIPLDRHVFRSRLRDPGTFNKKEPQVATPATTPSPQTVSEPEVQGTESQRDPEATGVAAPIARTKKIS